jgi:adenylate cyclase
MAQGGTRKLAAIMFTDIVGFSRQMGADEARMLSVLAVHNQVMEQAVAAHHGHVIKTLGDAFVVDFPSVVHAVQCAQHVQERFRHHNAQAAKEEQLHVRIGIHLGDIIEQNGDVLGDGVNIASRLQTLTEPDTICISQAVYQEVEKKLPLGSVVSLGRPQLKNIAQRFPVYALLAAAPKGIRQRLQVQRLKLSHRVRPRHRLVAAGLFLIAGTLLTVRYVPFPDPDTQPASRATPASLPLPDKPSIVVLPFDNMSGDPNQDYFSNGITEVLTSDLSRISSLFVIARNTAFSIGRSRKVQEVGRELDVRYVLEGSVQKAADQVRIVAQLIDATTGGHIWSERYDRPLTDIFALQDEIVQKIVTTLNLQLTLLGKGFQQVRKRTENLEAYDAFLRGVEYYTRTTKEANLQARQMFEKAVALDPQYAEAYALAGLTYYLEWVWRWSQDPHTLEQALAMAQRAVALDDALPMGHGILGAIYAQQRQYAQALAESERAVALDPNNASSYALRAEVLNFAGRPEEALRSVQQAMRLNPRYPPQYLISSGVASFWLGRYADAISTMKSLLAQNPNYLVAYPVLSLSYAGQWTFQQNQEAHTLTQALEAAQRAASMNNSFGPAHWALGFSYLYQRQYEHAIAEMEQATAVESNWADGYAVSQTKPYG